MLGGTNRRNFFWWVTNRTPTDLFFLRAEQRQRSVLQKVKVNDVDIPEGVTKYDLYKVRYLLR